jgi:hypothetical protein
MKQFLISEEERISILLKHKALMKEQTQGVQKTRTPEQNLRLAIKGGCIRNGGLFTTKDDPTKYVYRAVSDPGVVPQFNVDFFGDMTYRIRQSGKTGRWKMCQKAIDMETKAANDAAAAAELKKDNDLKLASYKKLNWKTKDEMIAAGVDVTVLDNNTVYDVLTVGNTKLYKPKGQKNDVVQGASTEEFNADEKDFLDRYDKLGYKLNPTQIERESLTPITAKQLGARPDMFPHGITLYYDPNKQSKLTTSMSDDLGTELTNQTPPRDVCKIKIENFYNYFRKRNSVLPDPDAYRRAAPKITKARLVVQACKDEYYPKKWGILNGGNQLNEYIEILSGDSQGGPSSQGPDKIFRLS